MVEEIKLPWTPFHKGRTPLDFGSRYLFASAGGKQIGIRWSHESPDEADYAIKLNDLAATVLKHVEAVENA